MKQYHEVLGLEGVEKEAYFNEFNHTTTTTSYPQLAHLH